MQNIRAVNGFGQCASISYRNDPLRGFGPGIAFDLDLHEIGARWYHCIVFVAAVPSEVVASGETVGMGQFAHFATGQIIDLDHYGSRCD